MTHALGEPLPWQVGPLRIDAARRRAHVAQHMLALTPREYDLLVALAQRAGRTCSRGELLRAVWGAGAARSCTLDSHASRLRRKLAVAGADGLLTNIWGVGYRLL